MASSLLVTGGTGTFGNAFIPEALKSNDFERIAIYSRDEHKQFEMRTRLGDEPRLRWFIGDVRDIDRLQFAMRGISHVVHAAALKHVPSGEYNPFEHVKTNVLGAQNVVMAAINAEVSKVMAVSTDKAVEPINLYGATKLCMERIFMASNALAPGRTAFSCVRYGNVMGSRGSFVETLKRLQAEGAKTFPLRNMESTRFWLEASAAARFVLDRMKRMSGSEIFVPKLPSSTALEFARRYLPDAEPEIVGVPPGEKIHETLISNAEAGYVIERDDFYIILPRGQRTEHAQIVYTSDRNPWNAHEAALYGGAGLLCGTVRQGETAGTRQDLLRRVREDRERWNRKSRSPQDDQGAIPRSVEEVQADGLRRYDR